MADTKRTILAAIRDQIRRQKDKQSEAQKWSPQHWWEAFQYLFIYSSGVNEQHQDDLLFFVRREHAAGGTSLPFFVRRRVARLPDELQLSGKDFSSVDWEDTVILNIVLQSQYQLTVVACGREALPFVAEGRTWTADMRTVTKPVFASATETAVNLDSSRASASNPAACYPDVCFAVEDFEDAFGEMVLQEAEQCYCVVLHSILSEGATAPADSGLNSLLANREGGPSPAFLADCHAAAVAERHGAATRGGAAGPPGSTADGRPAHAGPAADGDTGTPQGSEGSMANWTIGTRKRTLFAGFVSHQQIHEFIHNSSSNGKGQAGALGTLLAQVTKPAKDKVVMTGPGGMGRAEVAVTKLHRSNSMPGTGSVSSDGSGRPDSSNGLAATGAAAAGPAAAAAAGVGSPGEQVIPPIYKEPSGSGATPNSNPSGMAASNSSSSLGPPPATGSSSDTGDPRRLSGGGQAGGLLSRGINRARQVATGLQRLVAEIQGGGMASNSNLRCALMMLKLPVRTVAKEILEGL